MQKLLLGFLTILCVQNAQSSDYPTPNLSDLLRLNEKHIAEFSKTLRLNTKAQVALKKALVDIDDQYNSIRENISFKDQAVVEYIKQDLSEKIDKLQYGKIALKEEIRIRKYLAKNPDKLIAFTKQLSNKKL